MPRYHYECESCGYELQIRHSMEETLTECPECYEDTLIRVLPHVAYSVSEKISKVGDVVKRSIKEAKEAVAEDKRQSSKEYKS